MFFFALAPARAAAVRFVPDFVLTLPERFAVARFEVDGAAFRAELATRPAVPGRPCAASGAAPDAHLTGFDVLARYAHKFVVEHPHLVYAEPAAIETITFRLADAGFSAVRAQQNRPAVSAPVDETVLVRAQANAEQYGVRGPIAPPEKAWVDTLRETLRGSLAVRSGRARSDPSRPRRRWCDAEQFQARGSTRAVAAGGASPCARCVADRCPTRRSARGVSG